MSTVISQQSGNIEQLEFRVEGMDCASCVAKIETALVRMGGLSDVTVNFAAETLALHRVLTGRTTEAQIVKKIRSLGFEVSRLTPSRAAGQGSEVRASPAPVPQGACEGQHHDHRHEDHRHAHASGPGDDQERSNEHGHCSHTPGSHDHAPHSAPGNGKDDVHGNPDLVMRVEGMDCASCVGKIETALHRMPGVLAARVNFAAESLEVTLAENAVSAADIVKTIKTLGFEVFDVRLKSDAAIDDVSAHHPARPQRWWQTRKGRYVVGLGSLMGVAYVVAHLIPSLEAWIFGAAVVAGVIPFARKAFALAVSGSPFSIETLMVTAAVGALVIGEAEEAAAVVFLFAIGELLESVAAGRARAGIKALASLVPKTAVLLPASGGQRTVPASSLRIGDRVLVRPGDRVPADGKILDGHSSLDESPITGESMPRTKTIDEPVFAGSINTDGVLEVLVEKVASDNTISRIIHLVEQAQSAKAPTARFIENFSRYYTPIVMAVALLVVVVPPTLLGGEWGTWLYRGLALLLIACPCALVLSTPAAIASGLAVATRRGLLIKGGNVLEMIGRVDTIAFDKTGTLTEGKPKVTKVVVFDGYGEAQVLSMAAAVESASSHPLGKAIIAHAHSKNLAIDRAVDASSTPGRAVHATVNGRRLAVGSPAYATEAGGVDATLRNTIALLEASGNTVVALIDEQKVAVLGLLALRDEPRADARQGVADLKALGVRSIMLTGDNRRTADAIAAGLGVDCESELLPQDKLRLVNQMKQSSRVAMVGDGINDAPALAAADVGIAMGGGTDVALETADAALLKSRVTDVAHLIALSRATMANIHQNVVFALGLKGLFLVTSVMGVTGLWVAVLADTGATALVTLNALRLLRFKGAGTAPSSGSDRP